MKTLVMYHFFDRWLYYDNLLFFLINGIVENIDYVIISNVKLDIVQKYKNVSLFLTENYNSDFGGYASFLETKKKILGNYSNFIFINCTVRGPFQSNTKLFYKNITDKLSHDVDLYGMTINYLPKVVYNSNYSRFNKYNLTESDFFTHIQTQFYAFNRKVFDFLNKIEFWSWNRNFFEREYVISNYEISLTQILLQNGYTVKHGLSKYPYIVSTKSKIDPNYSSRNGDPNYRGAYFGATMTHQDTPLIKVNRNLLSPLHLLVISIRHLNSEYLWLSLIFILRATFYTILEYLKMPCILIIRILKFLAKVKG